MPVVAHQVCEALGQIQLPHPSELYGHAVAALKQLVTAAHHVKLGRRVRQLPQLS